MKNNLRRVIYLAVLVAACLLNTFEVGASRPSASEVARRRSSGVIFTLGRTIESLSTKQMAEIIDVRKGVKLIDGQVLKHLMNLDTGSESNQLYDDVMKMETGEYQCHYYCILNLDMKNLDSEFFLLDTRYGHLYGSRDEKFSNLGPRSLFKELCILTGNDELYEKYAAEFIEETENQKKQKATSARDSVYMAILTKYWLWLVIFSFLDFIFIDFSYMKKEKWPVKLYGLGLHLVCTVICLSIVTIHYTNTPIPDLRNFSHLASGSYPTKLHFMSDIILLSSFSWWAISIAATFMAPRYKCSPAIPLLYVVSTPLALAMSESPFGGSQTIAFPVCGLVIMLINAIYIRKKYQS